MSFNLNAGGRIAMSDYSILYIDEETTDNHQFERKMSEEFDVSTVDFTDITFEKLTSDLMEKDFDYLIVDYHLNDKSGCGFNGDEVIKEFVGKFPHFPTMLLTNHDQHAVDSVEGLDVDTIHNKKEYVDEERREVFIKRIKAKIDNYRDEIKGAEERIAALIEKKRSGSDLTANEEQEIVDLDTLLDETLGGDRSIPDDIKSPTNALRIESLLSKTDDLIARLKEYENIS